MWLLQLEGVFVKLALLLTLQHPAPSYGLSPIFVGWQLEMFFLNTACQCEVAQFWCSAKSGLQIWGSPDHATMGEAPNLWKLSCKEETETNKNQKIKNKKSIFIH